MRKIVPALILLVLISLGQNPAKAAGPQIFITWSANSYIPAGYAGKALPVNGSHLKARVAALAGSSFLDLSREEIAWYEDGDLIQDATGAQSIEFDVNSLTQSSLELKVQLLSMNGGPYSKTIEIPLVKPEAVIEYANPKNNIVGNVLSLTAWPFFFNVPNISGLNFSWQVNGQTPANLTDPQRLNIKSASGFQSGSIEVFLNIKGGNASAPQTETFTAR